MVSGTRDNRGIHRLTSRIAYRRNLPPCEGCQERRATNGGKLAEGVWLEIFHPEVARRPCELCQKYLFDKSGKIEKDHQGEPEERQDPTKTPCRTAAGCPKGTPEESKALTPQGIRVYEHYLECKAIGQFPNDSNVRRHARVIREIEEEANQIRSSITLVKTLFAGFK